jgi:hypothetical protein
MQLKLMQLKLMQLKLIQRKNEKTFRAGSAKGLDPLVPMTLLMSRIASHAIVLTTSPESSSIFVQARMIYSPSKLNNQNI